MQILKYLAKTKTSHNQIKQLKQKLTQILITWT